jgi:hypothetical protein
VPVDQHRVPLAERAAPGVLADQPHRVAVEEQRAEREQLAGRPVDGVLFDHGARLSSSGSSRGWTVKPSGRLTWVSMIRLTGLGGDRGRHRLVVDRAVFRLGLSTVPGSAGRWPRPWSR